MILLSTAYFPPISYIALLFQHQEGQIDLWETYSKQTYRNRCYIASASGLMALSVPVKKPFGNKSITKDITIDYTENWQQTHWRSIKSAYQSSPFFLYYQDEIEAVFKEKHGSLHQMNAKILGVLLDLIGFDVPLKITEGFIKPAQESNDFRFSIHPKKPSVFESSKYIQVFQDRNGFIPDLSILDLLFNMGPESIAFLEKE